MNRAVFMVGLSVLAMSLAGCFKFESHSTTKTGKGPGELTKEELEQKIVESNKWKSVSLEGGKDGVFAGTAITDKEEELKLEVRQSDTEIHTKWKNADGVGGGESTQSWSSTKRSDWSVKFP